MKYRQGQRQGQWRIYMYLSCAHTYTQTETDRQTDRKNLSVYVCDCTTSLFFWQTTTTGTWEPERYSQSLTLVLRRVLMHEITSAACLSLYLCVHVRCVYMGVFAFGCT